MKSSGYSGTPLARKLGLKNGFTIRVIGQPTYYHDLFIDFPSHLLITDDKTLKKDLIHFFARQMRELEENIFGLKNEIVQHGAIWISWPKKSSGVATDISEDLIRKLALACGLVDVKVCAVDDVWSGLKLVIPLKDRKI